jgi:hypothetical protein
MDEMTITAELITLKNRTIQVRNITEASVWEETSYKKLRLKFGIGGALSALIGFGFFADYGWVLVLIGTLLMWLAFNQKPKFELHLQTSAGKVTAVSSNDEQFIRSVLAAVQQAMSARGRGVNVQYNINYWRKKYH